MVAEDFLSRAFPCIIQMLSPPHQGLMSVVMIRTVALVKILRALHVDGEKKA